MLSSRMWMALCGALALGTGALHADDVILTNGQTLEGRARYENGKVVIEQPAGEIVIDQSRVEVIEKKRTVLDDFDDRRKAIDGNKDATAADYVGLARFAAENGITRHTEALYRKALVRDPENAEARTALGYVKHDGKWMSPEQANIARGLVEHKGTWVTPEAKADLIRIEAETELAKSKAEIERLKLERTERQLELVEAERDLNYERQRYDVYRPYYYGGTYRPMLGSKPSNGKPLPPPVTRPQAVGESMFPPGSVGNSLFPRNDGSSK